MYKARDVCRFMTFLVSSQAWPHRAETSWVWRFALIFVSFRCVSTPPASHTACVLSRIQAAFIMSIRRENSPFSPVSSFTSISKHRQQKSLHTFSYRPASQTSIHTHQHLQTPASTNSIHARCLSPRKQFITLPAIPSPNHQSPCPPLML